MQSVSNRGNASVNFGGTFGRKRSRFAAAILAGASVLAMSHGRSSAAILTWDSGGTHPTAPADGAGTWDTSSVVWSNGTTDQAWVNANGDTAVFGNGGAAGNPSAITVGAPVQAAGITFNATSAGFYRLTGTAVNNITLLGATPTITVNQNGSILAPLVSGTAGTGLTITGGAALTLGGPVTPFGYTGTTTINGSTLVLANTSPSANVSFPGPIAFTGTSDTLTFQQSASVTGSMSQNVTVTSASTTVQVNMSQRTGFGATGTTLTGAGTVNINAPSNTGGTRDNFSADATNFTGTLNIAGGGAVGILNFVTSGGSFTGLGGTLSINQMVQDTTNSGGNTITLGALSGGASGNILGGTSGNMNLSIGGLGANTSYAGAIGTKVSITLTGGSLTLSNPNVTPAVVYSGATAVNGGTLFVNTALPNSLTTVASGATLAGTGTIGLLVTDSGTIAPGATAGAIGPLTLSGGLTFTGASAIYTDDINQAGATDLINTTNLALGTGTTLNVNVIDTPSGSNYVIATYSGSLSGTFATTNVPTGYSVDYGTGTNSVITLVASVPEPASIGLFGFAGMGLLRRRRKVSVAS